MSGQVAQATPDRRLRRTGITMVSIRPDRRFPLFRTGGFAAQEYSLCEVMLPDGALEEIAEDAFWGCKSLTRIVLPKNLRKLGIRAFNRCEMLSDIIIPMGSLEKISDDTFSRCVNLNMVVIPENIKYIGNLLQFSVRCGILMMRKTARRK